MSQTRTAFHDLRPEDFPFTIEAYVDDGTVVWSQLVDGPGSVHVPDLARQHGPVGIRVTTPRGVSVLPPPKEPR